MKKSLVVLFVVGFIIVATLAFFIFQSRKPPSPDPPDESQQVETDASEGTQVFSMVPGKKEEQCWLSRKIGKLSSEHVLVASTQFSDANLVLKIV